MDPSRIANITILKDAAATGSLRFSCCQWSGYYHDRSPETGKVKYILRSDGGEVTMPDLSAYNLMNAKEKLETEVLAGAFEPYQSDVAITLEKKIQCKTQ